MRMMEIQVRLFAVFRERAGRERLTVELADGATVADALRALSALPGLADVMAAMPIRAARNREYVAEETRLRDGDELALVPPVSGGDVEAGTARVTDAPLAVESLLEEVVRPGAGAIVVFAGVTRDVERLEYEAYREMAEERIAAILAAVRAEHGLEAAAAEHRVGTVPLGEPSVVVAVSAAHREEAFAGAREAIDRIKAEAPIWKEEVEGGVARRVDGALPPADEPVLTHLDESGSARMVDVSAKPETARRARAEAVVRMAPATAAAVLSGDTRKGDVLGTARIGGIAAAKRTWELIPLAHPIPLEHIGIDGEVDPAAGAVRLTAEAASTGRTGVEMEAMTACAVAALTVYDMVKGVERGVTIETLRLLEKSGGQSGDWSRS